MGRAGREREHFSRCLNPDGDGQADRVVAAARDSEALLEVLPDDAPGEVRAYFEALSESLRMDEVWKDPETGLIEDEYFDDVVGGIQTMQDHEVAVGEYAEAQCSGGRGGGGGWLGQFAGGGGARRRAPSLAPKVRPRPRNSMDKGPGTMARTARSASRTRSPSGPIQVIASSAPPGAR